MSDRISLVFDAPCGRYQTGDSAQFTEAQAKRILATFTTIADDERNVVERRCVAHRETAADVAKRERLAAPKTERLVSIRFKHPVGRYAPGDEAGFPPAIAEKYVKGYRDQKGQRRPPVAEFCDDASAPVASRGRRTGAAAPAAA